MIVLLEIIVAVGLLMLIRNLIVRIHEAWREGKRLRQQHRDRALATAHRALRSRSLPEVEHALLVYGPDMEDDVREHPEEYRVELLIDERYQP